MTDPALYDLAPVWRMAALGLVLALGPLAWLWLRHHGADGTTRRRALAVLTLFLTFDLVLFGAFTRLSDSGLGCPDWPGCYGHASPIGAASAIGAAEAALPSGPVTHSKAWVEMVHRYFASAVGVLITVLMLAAWRSRGAARAWAVASFVWVCLQGAFGALTVTMKLYPAIVTLHLLGGLGLLALLTVQTRPASVVPMLLPRRLRWAAWGVLALLVVQVALGGWVSSNYAVLACRDFPTCQGQWWPPMDFDAAFAWRRALGEAEGGGYLPFAALTAIHMAHRLMALVVLAGLLALAAALYGEPPARRYAKLIALLALWQLASGASNVVLGWPIVAALAHTGGAAALVIVFAALLSRSTGAAAAGAAHWRAASWEDRHA